VRTALAAAHPLLLLLILLILLATAVCVELRLAALVLGGWLLPRVGPRAAAPLLLLAAVPAARLLAAGRRVLLLLAAAVIAAVCVCRSHTQQAAHRMNHGPATGGCLSMRQDTVSARCTPAQPSHACTLQLTLLQRPQASPHKKHHSKAAAAC
jgi:hypothetical protein